MNFSNIKNLIIPEGSVTALSIDGIRMWSANTGTAVGTLPVGTVITLDFRGEPTEFIVVHQGNPSAELYDNSCDGTWVLMKDAYSHSTFNDWDLSYEDSINNYAQSQIHTDLNNDFFEELDLYIQSNIKQIKIPYCNGGSGSNWGTVYSGANGLLTKIFLLSWHEVGLPTDVPDVDEEEYGGEYIAVDGAKLDYFISGLGTDAKNRRKAVGIYSDYTSWWLRTPNHWVPDYMYNVSADGEFEGISTHQVYSEVRPAFILNPSTLIKV